MSQDKINPVAVAVSSACSSGVFIYSLRGTHTIPNYTYSHFNLNHQTQDTWTWPSTLYPFLVSFSKPQRAAPAAQDLGHGCVFQHKPCWCWLQPAPHIWPQSTAAKPSFSIVVSTTPGQESPLCSLDTGQDVCDSARGHIRYLGSC